VSELSTEQPDTSLKSALGWGAFLGVSWTWCIGMCLPALLIRDHGNSLAAWVAFAVPNVLGAAAMGWTLGRPGHSQQLVAAHAIAGRAFSVVTIAFHLLFAWLIAQYASPVVGGAVLIALVAFALIKSRFDRAMAVALWVASIGLLFVVARQQTAELSYDEIDAQHLRKLASLSPVIVFGFLFCPYLDLTFHRARQAVSTGGARLAFTAGFGGFFLAMILGTLVYAKLLTSHKPIGDGAIDVASPLAIALGLHLGLQSAYTVVVHGRALRRPLERFIAAPVVVAVIVAAGWTMARWSPFSVFEVGYRIFMAFYGLVFPAYVWLCMIPSWRHPTGPTRRDWHVFGVAVTLATPFYWLGFLESRPGWLLPGLGIVLAARLFVRQDRHATEGTE
jgi:hypothetical protein